MDMESSSPSWPKETKSGWRGTETTIGEGNWGLRRPLRTVASRQIVISTFEWGRPRQAMQGSWLSGRFSIGRMDRMSFICHIHNYTEYNEE